MSTTSATPIRSSYPPVLHGRIDHYRFQRLRDLDYRPSSFASIYSTGFHEHSPLYVRRWKRCGVAATHQCCRYWVVLYHRCADNRSHGRCLCHHGENLGRTLEETKTELTNGRRTKMSCTVTTQSTFSLTAQHPYTSCSYLTNDTV